MDKISNDENMSDEGKKLSNDISENTCVVCFKDVEIFSIGECDHPVCYECSTRMRVLCQQNECPICRHSLSKVIFTKGKQTYRDLEINNRSKYYNEKYKICFATAEMQNTFHDLLEHKCPICDSKSFASFNLLSDHVRKQHERFYCDICTQNLKIFSFERKCYNRHDLGVHRRKGDPDNTSHRGHPLCEYCDCRYLDRDELFRHLRRNHHYCHICDADGANQFYNDINSLRDHFREMHYLCEEEDCAQELFSAVFRSEIDYKAHISNVHAKTLGKQLTKQARTLQLEITLGPRGRTGQIDQYHRQNNYNQEESTPLSLPTRNMPQLRIDATNEEQFPSLGGATASTAVPMLRPNISIRPKIIGAAGLARTKENFPALGGGGRGDAPPSFSSNSKTNHPPISAILKKNSPASQSGSGGSMLIHVSNRPNSMKVNVNTAKKFTNQKDFPALPGTSKSQNTLMDDDFIPPNNNVNMNCISAKHKPLVDGYVSVSQQGEMTKIKMVHNDSENMQKKSEQKKIVPPSLTNNDFPSLLGSSSNNMPSSNWVKSQRQTERTDRQSKIAPAPILHIGDYQKKSDTKKSNKFENVTTNDSSASSSKGNSKKDKKTSKSLEKKSTEMKKIDNNELNTTRCNDSKTSKSKEIMNTNSRENHSINKVNGNKDKRDKGRNSDHNTKSSEVNNKSKDSGKSTRKENEDPAATTPKMVSNPPPGFDVKPPPGFKNVTLYSVMKPRNDFTFTSSLGESYSIVPSHQYLPPPNSDKRNQALVAHFQSKLVSTEAVEEFRKISQMFQDGLYKALPYYEHCESALKQNFDDIFPELLVLLPDINKQQELYLVYSQNLKKSTDERKAKNKLSQLEVCKTCKQVLMSADLNAHTEMHSMYNNFPILNGNDIILSAKVKK